MLELLSYLFAHLPTDFQFVVAFMVAGCCEFDLKLRSKLVDKMVEAQDEASTVLVEISARNTYAFFIAVRLADATSVTLFCVVAIAFVLHLKTAIQTSKQYNRITVE